MTKLSKFYSKYIKYPGNDKFKPEFKFILQILYSFGWYNPITTKPTKLRIAYGVFTFSFVLGTFFVGLMRNGITAYLKDDWLLASLNFGAACIVQTFMLMIAKLALNPEALMNHIRELHSLHEYTDNEAMDILSKKSWQMVKRYTGYMLVLGFSPFLLPALGYNVYDLMIPVIYDHLAIGPLYYPMMFINAIHIILILLVIVVCDTLPELCNTRITKNEKFVASHVLHSTDSDDLEKNEREIEAVRRYHSEIKR